MEVNAQGSTLAADYDRLEEDESEGAPEAGAAYGLGADEQTGALPPRDGAGRQKVLKKGDHGRDDTGAEALGGLLRNVLTVSGVGDVAPGKPIGAAASRKEQQMEDEYNQLQVLQQRAEAAFNIILEDLAE